MFFAVSLLLTGFASTTDAGDTDIFGRYHALVIGNNDYQHLEDLHSAVNDAEAVAKTLREDYGFQVRLVLNATRATLIGAINDLRGELEANDNLLIYYAGHGYLDRETETGFWLPVDAAADNEANWVSVATLSRNAKASWAKHILIVAEWVADCWFPNYKGASGQSVGAAKERLPQAGVARRFMAQRFKLCHHARAYRL